PLTISRTLLEANSAGNSGGGISAEQSSRNILIEDSTLSRNSAQYGGAYYAAGGTTTMRNSTLSGNFASHDGGGIYLSGGIVGGQVWLFNATVAHNLLFRQLGPLRGGGLFLTDTAIITAQNSLIGDNPRLRNLVNPPIPDDCFTSATSSLHLLGANLLQTVTNCIRTNAGVL